MSLSHKNCVRRPLQRVTALKPRAALYRRVYGIHMSTRGPIWLGTPGPRSSLHPGPRTCAGSWSRTWPRRSARRQMSCSGSTCGKGAVQHGCVSKKSAREAVRVDILPALMQFVVVASRNQLVGESYILFAATCCISLITLRYRGPTQLGCRSQTVTLGRKPSEFC